jgi:hypothetical protein
MAKLVSPKDIGIGNDSGLVFIHTGQGEVCLTTEDAKLVAQRIDAAARVPGEQAALAHEQRVKIFEGLIEEVQAAKREGAGDGGQDANAN